MAGAVNLCCGVTRGSTARSVADNLHCFDFRRGEWSAGSAKHAADYLFAYRAVVASGRFPAVWNQRTGIAVVEDTIVHASYRESAENMAALFCFAPSLLLHRLLRSRSRIFDYECASSIWGRRDASAQLVKSFGGLSV